MPHPWFLLDFDGEESTSGMAEIVHISKANNFITVTNYFNAPFKYKVHAPSFSLHFALLKMHIWY